MSRIFCLARNLVGSLTCLFLLLPGFAQADPPGRVGRLAFIENSVNFRVDRGAPGEPASLNWPITQGAVLDSMPGARAEVWIGSTALRVAGSADIEFARLDDEAVVVNLAAGALAISILDRDQTADLTVMTPDGGIRFKMPGRYRIDVQADQTLLIVQAGQAEADDAQWKQRVWAGQQAQLRNGKRVKIESDRRPDAFDAWVAERENASMATVAGEYVSPQMTGYQDLDHYGEWQQAPEYGAIWYPRNVGRDWAPYRDGRWAWVEPWGWTWIDQAPWGFAPFHYGRWVLIRNRWAWVPGQHVPRPVYAPALVGWVGNPGWNVNFSFGAAPAVGWFPLAPREVYVPAHRHTPAYIRQINVTHVQDVTLIERAARPGAREQFAHRDRPQAVTVVPAKQLLEGRPISATQVDQPSRRALVQAPKANLAAPGPWVAPAQARAEETRQRRDGQGGHSRPSGEPLRSPAPAHSLPTRGSGDLPLAPTESVPTRQSTPAERPLPANIRRQAPVQEASAPVGAPGANVPAPSVLPGRLPESPHAASASSRPMPAAGKSPEHLSGGRPMPPAPVATPPVTEPGRVPPREIQRPLPSLPPSDVSPPPARPAPANAPPQATTPAPDMRHEPPREMHRPPSAGQASPERALPRELPAAQQAPRLPENPPSVKPAPPPIPLPDMRREIREASPRPSLPPAMSAPPAQPHPAPVAQPSAPPPPQVREAPRQEGREREKRRDEQAPR